MIKKTRGPVLDIVYTLRFIMYRLNSKQTIYFFLKETLFNAFEKAEVQMSFSLIFSRYIKSVFDVHLWFITFPQ